MVISGHVLSDEAVSKFFVQLSWISRRFSKAPGQFAIRKFPAYVSLVLVRSDAIPQCQG
jgi:hypothetical protein